MKQCWCLEAKQKFTNWSLCSTIYSWTGHKSTYKVILRTAKKNIFFLFKIIIIKWSEPTCIPDKPAEKLFIILNIIRSQIASSMVRLMFEKKYFYRGISISKNNFRLRFNIFIRFSSTLQCCRNAIHIWLWWRTQKKRICPRDETE